MRRNYPPYNGKRYLLNKRTNELHDLDNETANCQINEIDTSNIEMFNELLEAMIYLHLNGSHTNGCYWCNKDLDNG